MEYNPEKLKEAISVLQKSRTLPLVDSKTENDGSRKVALIPDQPNIALTIVQKRLSRQKYRRLRCELPKPFRVARSADVCLIIKDISREKTYDQERGVERYKDLLRRAGVSGITEVLTFTQLRSEYKPYEAKRKLLNRYNIFLADERIYGRLAAVLGSKFFTKNRFPIPVNISGSQNLPEEIKSAIEATYLTIQGKGAQTSVDVAAAEQPAEEIFDNTQKILDVLKEKFPGGWKNIRSLYLKLGKVSLPFYINTDTPNFLPIEKQPITKGFEAAPEEVTTVKDAKVKISRSGSVKLLKKRNKRKAKKNAS